MGRHFRAALRGFLGYAVLLAGLAACAAPAPCLAAGTLTLQGSSTFNSELMAVHQGRIEAAARVKLKVVANKSNSA